MIFPCNECGEIKGLMQKDASFCMMCGAPASQGIVVPKVSNEKTPEKNGGLPLASTSRSLVWSPS